MARVQASINIYGVSKIRVQLLVLGVHLIFNEKIFRVRLPCSADWAQLEVENCVKRKLVQIHFML